MTLPTHAQVMPSDLVGAKNGAIVPGVHVQVEFDGIGMSWLHHLAARSFLAMRAACKAATGFTLTADSQGDVLRTYDQQMRGFVGRYVNHFDPNTCNPDPRMNRTWNGVVYYLLKGRIPAAVPGTSNHGWGLAFDGGVWTGTMHSTIGCAPVWNWLKANVLTYGWSWAYPQEGIDDPHLQYWSGNAIPAAVLAFEAHQAAVQGQQPAGPPRPPHLPAPPSGVPPLKVGSSGAPVGDLQTLLAALGLYPYTIDQQFGPKTHDGVANLQRRLGFVGNDVDGIYGPHTAAAFTVWPQLPKG